MPNLIRPNQPIITRLTPHNGNKRFIVPNRRRKPSDPIATPIAPVVP